LWAQAIFSIARDDQTANHVESNDGSIVTILYLTTAITHIARHSFEHIGNHLYFSLELQAKLDSYVQKNEEAEE
jgi:hypothetical protein